MAGSGGSYQGNEDMYAGYYIGTQPVQSQNPAVLFDPRLFQMQSNGQQFLQMIPPYSFVSQIHELATPPNHLAIVANRPFPLAAQHAGPFVQQKQDALALNEDFGMNMSYTQMLLAADSEAAFFGSPHTDRYPVGAENETFMVTGQNSRLIEENDMDVPASSNCLEYNVTATHNNNQTDPWQTGSPHTDRYPVGAENETFMVTGRNSSINEENDTDIPASSNYLEYNDTANGDNNWIDSCGADLSVQALTWKDGVAAPGADLLQALGMSVYDNEIEDEARSEDSETDSTAFLNVLAVTEEDAPQVVVEDDLEQNNNADVDDDDQQLSQDDIDNFLENDCIVASQSCSQEVRKHHAPHMGMDFDSSTAAQAYYNNYASLCGFAVRKASNYHGQTAPGGGESRCIFRCNRAGKVLDEEQKEARRKKGKRGGKRKPES